MKTIYLILVMAIILPGICAAHEEIDITFNENNTYTVQAAGEILLQPFIGIDPETGDLYRWEGHIA
jgi:hypothetical protein